jgi:hypothetical protein
MTSARYALVLAVGSIGLVCGSDGREFVAVQTDFAGCQNWHCANLGQSPLADDPPGVRMGCINHVPPATATVYPVGTIIVKQIESDPNPMNWDLFGMVKCGGTYNESGALGWEFFLLRPGSNGDPMITARGIDLSYNGGSVCNSCHGTPASAATDHVLDAPLRLRASP